MSHERVNHRRRYSTPFLSTPEARRGVPRISDEIVTSTFQYTALVNGPESEWRLCQNHVLGRSVYCDTAANYFVQELMRDMRRLHVLDKNGWHFLRIMFAETLRTTAVSNTSRIKDRASLNEDVELFIQALYNQYELFNAGRVNSACPVPGLSTLHQLLTPLLRDILQRINFKPTENQRNSR